MNPLYQALNKNSRNDVMDQFQAFVQQMQGKNPDAMIQELVSSGKVSQAQLNQAQQQAQQMMGLFKR